MYTYIYIYVYTYIFIYMYVYTYMQCHFCFLSSCDCRGQVFLAAGADGGLDQSGGDYFQARHGEDPGRRTHVGSGRGKTGISVIKVICKYIYAEVCVYIYICLLCIQKICVYIYTHTYIYIYMFIMYTKNMYIYIHTYTYIYIYIYIVIFICIQL